MTDRLATPAELRDKAAHYRDMVRKVFDRQLIDALTTLADEYDALADWLEREDAGMS